MIAACSGFTSSSTEIPVEDSGVDVVSEAGESDAPATSEDGGGLTDSGPAYDAGKIERDPSTGCPVGRGPKMVISNTRCVDESEVTESQFNAAVTQLNLMPRKGKCALTETKASGGSTNRAVSRITWCDASTFCNWAGKHLCNDTERNAVVCHGHPVTPYTGCNLSSSGPRDVKSSEQCKSAEGVYDAVGNVDEFFDFGNPTESGVAYWAGSDWGTGVYGSSQCSDPYFKYGDFDGLITSTSGAIGFRCCADPVK